MNIHEILIKADLKGEGKVRLRHFSNNEKLYKEDGSVSETTISDFVEYCPVNSFLNSDGKIAGDWRNSLSITEIEYLENNYEFHRFEVDSIQLIRNNHVYDLSNPNEMSIFKILSSQQHIAPNEAHAKLYFEKGTDTITHFFEKLN